MENQNENLATIDFCIERIEEILAQESLENRWLWEVRLKIAQYVQSYLKLHQKKGKIELPVISEQEKEEIISNHPLLQPFDQASIGITKDQRDNIQKEIYDKVHKMYLFRKDSDTEKTKKKKV